MPEENKEGLEAALPQDVHRISDALQPEPAIAMESRYLEYSKGYKYQTRKSYAIQTPFRPKRAIRVPGICSLDTNGLLIIRPRYAWDGPSGPALDTKTFMAGSLVHDVLTQLVRLGLLDRSLIPQIHDFAREVCLRDGMWKVRAWWVNRALKRMADPSTRPSSEKLVLRAP